MKYELVFRVNAEKDLTDIEEYYKSIANHINTAFFKELFSTLTFIEQNPLLFQIRYRGVRIAPLYRFPYGIHYKVTADKITVFRILHSKRYFK